jgi:hypothetical protein
LLLLRPARVPQECHIARALRVNGFHLRKSAPGDALVQELRGRRESWITRLQGRPRSRDFVLALQSFDKVTLIIYSAGMATVGIGLLLSIVRSSATPRIRFDWSPCLLQIGVWVPVLTHFYFGLRIRRRLRGALARVSCPDCGYDLRGLAPAVSRAQLDGVSTGPERCPECGSLWPLIPPPESPTACRTEL